MVLFPCFLHQGGKECFLKEYPEFRKPRPRNAPSPACRAVKCCSTKLPLLILLSPLTCHKTPQTTSLHVQAGKPLLHCQLLGSTRLWADPGDSGALEMVERRGTDPSRAAGQWDTFLQSSTCFHGWWHHGKCHTTTSPRMGSQHLQQLHLRKSSLVFWISTDRAGKSAEDGQVRKTSAGEY